MTSPKPLHHESASRNPAERDRARGSRPLRVLYVAHTGAGGGAGRSLRYLIENLPAGTVEPLVISPPGPAANGFRAAGAQVFEIPGVSVVSSIEGASMSGVRNLTLFREVWYSRHVRTLRRLMRDAAPDLIHLNERGMFQAARVAAETGVPVVMHARSIADHSNPLVEYVDRGIQPLISHVVCIDQCVRRSLRGYDRCSVIYNPLPFAPEACIAAPAAPRRETTAMFLSGLLPCKGIWDLADAALLLRNRKDIVFHICGGNARPREFYRTLVGRLCKLAGLTPDLERTIESWIRRNGVESTVRLMGHVQPSPELFADVEVLVFPSRLNGVGRSVFEAGICGVPSIVSMEDRVEDIVEHEVTGLIVDTGDASDLAAAIARLADNPELRRRLGENARRKYSEQFDARRIGRQMLDLYHSLLAERRVGLEAAA